MFPQQQCPRWPQSPSCTKLNNMNISILSLQLGLGGKCLLDWALVFFQRNHILRSFLGVFSVSLTVVDTALTLSVTTIHINGDDSVWLLGLKMTRHHICLLVQILGRIYEALQWPVVVSAGLDHLFTIAQRVKPSGGRVRWFVYLLVTTLLWHLAAVYVFLLSDFTPVLEDVSHLQIHQCWVARTSHILQVVTLLLLTLGCFIVQSWSRTKLLHSAALKDQSEAHSRRSVVYQAAGTFLTTWALFLLLLAVLLLLPVGIPAHLGMNAAWICFLNSLLIAVVLCGVCPAVQLAKGSASVPPDSFCEWRFKFSPAAAEDRAGLHEAKPHTELVSGDMDVDAVKGERSSHF